MSEVVNLAAHVAQGPRDVDGLMVRFIDQFNEGNFGIAVEVANAIIERVEAYGPGYEDSLALIRSSRHMAEHLRGKADCPGTSLADCPVMAETAELRERAARLVEGER